MTAFATATPSFPAFGPRHYIGPNGGSHYRISDGSEAPVLGFPAHHGQHPEDAQ